MQTIEAFMRSFFARRAELFRVWDSNSTPFRAKYFTAGCLANCRKIWDEELARRSKEAEVILTFMTKDDTPDDEMFHDCVPRLSTG